jgi:NagD protein
MPTHNHIPSHPSAYETTPSTSAKGGFLLDMDGVIYKGSELIPGADEFIRQLLANDIPFMFLTNNSQRSQLDVVTKLRRMGITASEAHVFTCAMATAHFLREQKQHATAFVIGEGGLLSALHDCDIAIVDHTPDYVVIGEGRNLSFEQLEQATRMVMSGAKLIATNLDPNCPTSLGLRPGAGAIVRAIEAATGRQALGLGKPSPVMMRMACRQLGLQPQAITMIGDTMDTDILGGVQMGFTTILVLSGGTRAEDLDHFAYLPDIVAPSLQALIPMLQPSGRVVLDSTSPPPDSRRDLTPVWDSPALSR